jgi:hypothetical protein
VQLFDDGALDQSAYMDLKSLNAKKIEQAILSQRKIYVDKHVFLHRFYVGLNMQQSMSRLVSKTLDDFLPITRAMLTRPCAKRSSPYLCMRIHQCASLSLASTQVLQSIYVFVLCVCEHHE